MVAKPYKHKRRGLVLLGGGARAAYQVGVLMAIAKILPKGVKNPFPIISGTSAGAINSAALAIYGMDFRNAVKRMSYIWRNFRVHHVFRSDFKGIASSGAHWFITMMFGGLGKKNPVSLLDREPLERLLQKYVPCERLHDAMKKGVFESICISASSYGIGKSVIFYKTSNGAKPWARARRFGLASPITCDHLMASSAIPFLFSAVKIDSEFYGDGSMRQTAPISPAIHMGADSILIIGVTQEPDKSTELEAKPHETNTYPTIGNIASHILNSIFIDSLEADLERLRRVNNTIEMIPEESLQNGDVKLRKIDTLVIEPSEDIETIANQYQMDLPWSIRFLLRGIGAMGKKGGSMVSYLLFEKSFCRHLIDMGYADAMRQKQELLDFFELPVTVAEKQKKAAHH